MYLVPFTRYFGVRPWEIWRLTCVEFLILRQAIDSGNVG